MGRELGPVTRAYLLGFLYTAAPKVLTTTISHSKRKARAKLASTNGATDNEPTGTSQPRLGAKIAAILKKSIELHRFPMFCAVLVGGWTTLLPLMRALLKSGRLNARERELVASFLAATGAGYAGIKLLNSKENEEAGRSLDMTLFAVVRAFDVLLQAFWRKGGDDKRTRVGRFIKGGFDEAMFAASSAVIMYAWFYWPEALPKSYNKWLDDIAQVDKRLLTALRKMHTGEFEYGKDTGHAYLLGEMCTDLGMPAEAGDPMKTIPIPCKLVHEGRDISCERNALDRGLRGLKYAFTMYLALNSITKLRKPSRAAFKRALTDSIRSSSFLAGFIAIFWYGVCLTRTRVGPKLFPKVTPLEWDRDYIVKTGCLLCGWTIFLEIPSRHADLALFCTPRAAATLLPRKYDVRKRWKEEAAFALSAGVLMTAARFDKKLIRGVFGRILGSVAGQAAPVRP